MEANGRFEESSRVPQHVPLASPRRRVGLARKLVGTPAVFAPADLYLRHQACKFSSILLRMHCELRA